MRITIASASVLFLVVPEAALAFAPQKQTQYCSRSLSALHTTIGQKIQPLPSNDSSSSIASSFEAVIVPPEDVVRVDGNADDVGKEIFLSNLEEMNNDAEFLLRAEYDAAAAVDQAPLVDPIDQMIHQNSPSDNNHIDIVVDDIVLPPPLVDVGGGSTGTTTDAVETILAVSGEAVAAAAAEGISPLPTSIDEITTTTTTKKEATPASPIPSEPITSDETFASPSVGKILRFAIPAIGVWLCGPLLSLIDTSSVGLLSGTTQQAALNPAVAVTDYAALLVAFLYTGTTNLMAAAKEKDRLAEGSPRATKTLVGALQMSTFVGTGLGAILFVFARPLLKALIGNDGISPAVFAAAMKYVRIRSLGMPAAAVIGSAQAACLGMQDIKTPLYVLGAAAVVNFLGDMLFVGQQHPWVGGAAGAAWATTFSQYAALAFFLKWLCSKPRGGDNPKVMNLSNAILELTGKKSSAGAARRRRFRDSLKSFRWRKSTKTSSNSAEASSVLPRDSKGESKPNEASFSAKGFLHDKFTATDLVKPPSDDTVKDFKPYVLPVTSTQVGRVSGYVAMSHVVSSSLGTVSMAAQQVLVSLFYCLCPVADSLSLTAQSFVPSISEKAVSHARAKALRRTLMNFLKAGGVFGLVMAGAVMSIPLLSGFFTTDQAVISLVNMVSPLLICWFAVHGFVCSAEGILLGTKDLSFLGRMYAAYFAIVPFFMLRVKKAALSGRPGVNLTSIWSVFLTYQLSRFAIWAARAFLMQRRTDREAAQLGLDKP